MARAGVAGAEAARVGGVEMRLLRRDAGAFGIGDAPVDGERRRFAARRRSRSPARRRSPRDGTDRGRAPPPRRSARSSASGRPAAGSSAVKRAMSCAARTVCSSAAAREVGRARVAAPLADVDGDADRLVAIALDVLGLALAHRDRQADAFGDLGDGVARAERLRASPGRSRRARGTARANRRSRRRRRWRRGGCGHVGRRRRSTGRRDDARRTGPRRRRGRGYDNDALFRLASAARADRPRIPPIPASPIEADDRRRVRRPHAAAEQDPAQAGVARAAGARRGACSNFRDDASGDARPRRAAARRAPRRAAHRAATRRGGARCS